VGGRVTGTPNPSRGWFRSPALSSFKITKTTKELKTQT
jgi:hypothetical protein